jgi:hypothetical protein
MVVSKVMKLITDMQHVGSMYYLAICRAVTRVHPHDSKKVWILSPFIDSAYIKKFLVGRSLGQCSGERERNDCKQYD